jgi:hypothetical protein
MSEPTGASISSPASSVKVTAAVLGAVVASQLLIVGSYVGAFHNLTGKIIPIVVGRWTGLREPPRYDLAAC